MATIIGRIYPNEGFSCVKRATTAWNVFMVNVSSTAKIAVYDKKRNYMDYAIKFQSSSGSWRWGYVASKESPSEDLIKKNCDGIDEAGVRSFYASNTIQGGMAVMIARHRLKRYNLHSKFVGYIEPGEQIAFKDGTCGARNPHWLYACYWKPPNNSYWIPINNNDDAGSDDGWVDTQCNTKGYAKNWGIKGARNG
jgi:hypothetical protein